MADTTINKDSGKGAPPSSAAGGFKPFMPLVLVLVLMPALAYVMTSFILVPKLQKSLGLQTVSAREPAGGLGETDGKTGGAGGAETVRAKSPRTKVALSKIVVNVSGSLGTRLLLASVTLAGSSSDFRTRVEDSTDQLRDIASGVLASKTISDLEKPEARNLIRAELLSQFNSILGGAVQDLYITEFAIQ